MRSLTLVIAALIATLPISAQTSTAPPLPRLTNREVLEMVKAGISSDVIIAKVKVSRCNFDTEPTVLADLRYKGVPNEVLKAMIEAPYGPPVLETPTEDRTPAKASDAEVTRTSSIKDDERLLAASAAMKALRKLKSASEVGVSYVNYSPLVVDAKTEVEDAVTKMPDDPLKTAILKSLRQYEFASQVWNRYWRTDFVDGDYKDIAVNQYGVKKKGLLRVVWRADFLRAIWNEASNQFEVAQRLAALPRDINGTRHVLTGAWTIIVTGNETITLTLTVEPNGDGMLRTPQGNASASISCNQKTCSISASDTYEKRLVSIRLNCSIDAVTLHSDGTREATSMAGTADIDDGKRKGSFPFSATRL